MQEKINQKPLAEDVSNKIKYEFFDSFLVKPLTPVKDKNGIEATDYDKVKKEVKEVDSDYLTGIVLKVPYRYTKWMGNEKSYDLPPIHVGDTIFYKARHFEYFDLVKDSHLVRQFDIIGKVHD